MNSNYEQLLKENTPLILIVDDIPKNLQVLSNILNAEGYQISFASNGEQAISVVNTTAPDLILLDIMMPEMDGYEVCEKLKADDKTAHIPIIFLTGKAESEDIVRGLKLGAVDYITKPFNSAELLSRVRTHLELKLSRDAIVKYNSELEEAQKELRLLNASKDKFFSIISHDLRGPFSGFLGLSELLAEEYDDLEKEDISQIAESMNKAAKRLFSFLENLLDWSRSQMGRMDFNPMQLDLFDHVFRIFELYSNTSKEKNIELVSDISRGNYIYSDSNMLSTILRNLISNAIKFTKPGGKIIVQRNDIPDSNFAEISVVDSGVGMGEDALSKLFRIDEKYTTVGTAQEAGTGLGLLLCKELVEKNGGSIRVESEIDKGTTFTFTVPLKEPSK